jgi:hypothetical protein
MARYTVLSETNNIDTNWSTLLTLLRDLEHRFIPTKTINMNGRRRNTFPTSVSENSASAGLYRFSFGLTSVIPIMFGLLSLVLTMSSAILLNNWSAFV